MLVSLSLDHVKAVIYVSGLSSPKTRKALIQALPARAKARRVMDGLLIIELNLRVAPEGHRRTLCRGEVAYWPPASSLVVALWRGCREVASPLNYLGFVVEGVEALESLSGTFDAELWPSDWENVKGSLIDSQH
ncbi:MAG: cyclophilin-like family protein [Thermofilaceae archaeon]